MPQAVDMANASPDLDNAEAQRQLHNNNRPSSSAFWETECTSSKLFECSRIRALADERDAVQKKTFTKWVNSHLSRVSCRISDLYTDLRDGYMLTRLLEVLSGELLNHTVTEEVRMDSMMAV
uniref:Calponin-homology (CH) domain-containing protein n=1 Tax=Knipowitschia caucasica TaxID=637954 RepID=A0AAV2IXZ7_KNICA